MVIPALYFPTGLHHAAPFHPKDDRLCKPVDRELTDQVPTVLWSTAFEPLETNVMRMLRMVEDLRVLQVRVALLTTGADTFHIRPERIPRLAQVIAGASTWAPNFWKLPLNVVVIRNFALNATALWAGSRAHWVTACCCFPGVQFRSRSRCVLRTSTLLTAARSHAMVRHSVEFHGDIH